ncbi:MAG: CpsD/CapB family tyrosine-protein kinase [Terrisporobacter othiniensis]|uniref:CpsD/CapB family tyrosine-protein kinase n=1 Tax=Terrisporobacter petrolearius TaxID=1460447 RepID=UPI0022E3E69B|nr:CpsD/CapB family tyrosine-protein kinase [Terrisporobacter petrolearius]MDU4862739.1 CpsD/CapB family tyrosine-protein kinase [Terrisporobacter othiniensis]MDU6996931.1 CpsD/CapB family tyrosine-protein kinase [Terrisporobacter othiniensis]
MLGLYDSGSFEVNEAYREIRTNISLNTDLKTIVFTSAEMNEGKTTTACSIAKCFSDLDNHKILLIDCDFRKKSVANTLEIDNKKGIADVIINDMDMKECIKKVDEFDVLTCGISPSNTSVLLESKKFRDAIENLKGDYDYIFIDSPPLGRLNDAAILARYSDGTIIVNASESIDQQMAKVTKDKLEKVNANVIGVVLNKFKSDDHKYYKYYGYYDEEKKKSFFKRRKRR